MNSLRLRLGEALLTSAVLTTGCGDVGDEPIGVDDQAITIPDDPLFSEQWGLRNTGQVVQEVVEIDQEEVVLTHVGIPGVDINATKAWDITQGSSAVIVAVIETQDMDITHEDIRDQILKDSCGSDVGGCDFVDGDGLTGVSNGHPNHVAGIIAARKDNDKGVAGTAPKIKIIPMRAVATNENNSFVNAVAYARSKGARIVHLSQGEVGGVIGDAPSFFNSVVRDTMLQNQDILFVCSAGNEASARYNFPSDYQFPSSSQSLTFAEPPNILAVANVTNRGELGIMSSYGEHHVDIAAPGVGIFSMIADNQYDFRSGTSQAAPFVTGTAALIMNKFPNLSAVEVARRIKRTGMRLASLRGMVSSGAMVDAYAALTDVLTLNNFNATSILGRITLSWDRVPNATRYDVERDGQIVNNGNSNVFVHNVAVGSAHFYRVRAIVGGSATQWSQRWMKLAVRDPITEILETPVQSPHFPYPNNLNKEEVAFDRPNAVSIRVHFQRLEVQGTFDTGTNNDFVSYCRAFEPNCDEGGPNHFFGDYSQGFWTHFAPAPFSFWFTTDASINNFYGYRVDRIEYLVP